MARDKPEYFSERYETYDKNAYVRFKEKRPIQNVHFLWQ